MEARQVFGSLPAGWESHLRFEFCGRCGSRCEQRTINGLPRSVCPNCGYIRWVNPAPGVAVVVADDEERVLLVRRAAPTGWAGKWCLPSGFIEYNEDFLTAGRREVEEESGLQVEIEGLLSVVTNFWEHGANTVVVILLARPLGGEPRTSAETDAVEWFRWGEMPELCWEADAHIIERYFATRLPGAAIDPHFARQGTDAGWTPPPAARFAL